MAENMGLPPRLDDIFKLLSGFPQERLLGLRRELEQLTPTTSARLLEAIVLQSLGHTAPALEMLKALANITAAQYITNKIQSEQMQCRGPPVAPPQDRDYLQTEAQVYTLLKEQHMLGGFSRDIAYKDVDQPRTLRSSTDLLTTPTSPMAISPGIPINRENQHTTSSVPGSLRSSSLDSLTSNLAISQSPTALFLSASGRRSHQPRDPSKLCEDTTSYTPRPSGDGETLVLGDMDDEDAFVSHPVECKDKSGCLATGPVLQTLPAPLTSERYPVECTDIPDTTQLVTAAFETGTSKAQKAEETSEVSPTCNAEPGTSCLTRPPVEATIPQKETENKKPIFSAPNLPVEDTRPPEKTEDKKPISSSPNLPVEDTRPPEDKEPSPSSPFGPQSTDSDNTESTFFSFVVLHVKEDEETACRVRDALESLGISNGTTYCEEFARPGCSPLKCIQDAIDNSAFTVLLLTKRWKSHWANFQANTALMNAIQQKHKYNTVIPFLPCSDPLEEPKIPMVLKSLHPLDESSSRFARVVKNTFRPEAIRKQKDIWRREEEIRILEKKTVDLEKSANLTKQMQETYEQFIRTQQMFNFFQPMPSMWPSAPPGFTGSSPSTPSFPPGAFPFQQFPWTPGTPPTAFSPAFPCYPHFPAPMTNIPPHFYPCGPYSATQTVYQQHPGIPQGTQYASGGQHPVIQIQHASNVQIGDQNRMTIDGAEDESEATTQQEEDNASV